MLSEETPLLKDVVSHQAVYDRFSKPRKNFLTFLVSLGGLLPRTSLLFNLANSTLSVTGVFVSGTLFPVIPQIARDLKSTASVVSLAVSLSIFAASFGGLCAASYSTFYGRRPIYLVTLPLLCIGSLGVATSVTIPQLMFWRFIQAFGASPGLTVGAGVVADLYRLEERGQAMGIFFAACLLGPALAPLAGGLAAHFASWRMMQLLLGVVGFSVFIVMILYFPETSHPGCRGVDKLQTEERLRWTSFIVNPLGPLALLRSPNITLVALAGYAVLLTDFVLLVPLPYTIGARYNITNEALIGACFLPAGIGNMIGAPLAGRISDKIVVKWRERRGVWYPEDRLRATLPGALALVPLSLLLSGLITRYVGGPIGLTLNLICLFLNGIGVDIVLSPSAAYNVDILHHRSAEAMAANSGCRALLLSLSTAAILPLINKYGVAFTNALFAAIALVAFVMLRLTIHYGEQMRGWVDVGYSTLNDN
ncbi:hypothetical protein AX17_001951 [Amanita inopinata Kibby_2008]|nr:hypothetical protein AX17_001951 [Amanita inopinata Kibby_2008]